MTDSKQPLTDKEKKLCESILEVLSNNEATSIEGIHALLSCYLWGFHLAYSSIERVQFEEAIRSDLESVIACAMKMYDEAKKETWKI